MLNNLVKHISSPQYKANEELKGITSALESVIDAVASSTKYNYCISALDQLGERINDFGRDQLIHCEKRSDAELLPCKLLVAKALNEISVQDFASALARANGCNQTEGMSLWLNDVSKEHPFLALTIDRLAVAAERLLVTERS